MTTPKLEAENPYEVLGLERGADTQAIKTAYFRQVREHSPEKDPDGFTRIRAAYELLRTPEKRMETDMLMVQVAPAPALSPLPSHPGFQLDPADVIAAGHAQSDLGRADFSQDYREVSL